MFRDSLLLPWDLDSPPSVFNGYSVLIKKKQYLVPLKKTLYFLTCVYHFAPASASNLLCKTFIILRMNESVPTGGSGSGRGRNKRFWTSEEDKALVGALHELSTDPHWKCENGFRNGYMIRLEELIGKAVPGCGLKATPHIDSRLKTLVSKFRAILQMLGTSGFKWDDERHVISVERSVYDEYCKDYATGKPAEGFEDAVGNMEKEKNIQVNIVSSDDDGGETQSVQSASLLKKAKTEKPSKKRKIAKGSESSSSSDLASLQQFMKDMNSQLSTMANVWVRADNREQDTADKCSKVLDELLGLDGLSPTEAMEAANILTAQPNKLNIFFSCPADLKKQYVLALLGFASSDGGDRF